MVSLTACLGIQTPSATPSQKVIKKNELAIPTVKKTGIPTISPGTPAIMTQVTETFTTEENLPGTSSPNPGESTETITETLDMDIIQVTETESPIVRTRLEATDPSSVNLASGKASFIEFFAFWCPKCKSMAPIVYKIESEYSERINFYYLDIDDTTNDQLKEELGYMYPPHFLYLDAQGSILHEWLGLVSIEEFDLILTSTQ